MSVAFSPLRPQFAKVGGAVVGADVQALRSFATYINNQLTTGVQQAFNQASSQIPNIQWAGADATQFESTWSGMLTQIASTLNNTLDSLTQHINKEAQQQETASGS